MRVCTFFQSGRFATRRSLMSEISILRGRYPLLFFEVFSAYASSIFKIFCTQIFRFAPFLFCFGFCGIKRASMMEILCIRVCNSWETANTARLYNVHKYINRKQKMENSIELYNVHKYIDRKQKIENSIELFINISTETKNWI